MDQFLESSKLHDKMADAIAKEVGKCSPQLFFNWEEKPHMPLYAQGSSVVVEVSERYFLITAAHVFHEEKMNQIGIAVEHEFYCLGGTMKYYEPNTGEKYEPNNIDIAICELDNNMVEVIREKYTFLPFHKFNLSFRGNLARYVLFGYPAETTFKNIPAKEIRPQAFILRTISFEPNYYQLHKIDRLKVIAVRCNLSQVYKTSTESVTTNKELEGISGGGLWQIHDDSSETNPLYHLAGIITGRTDAVVYATRIEVILELLRRDFGILLVY